MSMRRRRRRLAKARRKASAGAAQTPRTIIYGHAEYGKTYFGIDMGADPSVTTVEDLSGMFSMLRGAAERMRTKPTPKLSGREKYLRRQGRQL